jgi:hypothetical protein
VADSNTGNVAIYTLLWNRTAAQRNMPQAGKFTLLAKDQGRILPIR